MFLFRIIRVMNLTNYGVQELNAQELKDIDGGTPTNPGNGIIGTLIGIISFGWGFVEGVIEGAEAVIEANN